MTFSSVPCEHWYECDDRAVFLASINKLQLKSCSKWGMCESYGDANGNVPPFISLIYRTICLVIGTLRILVTTVHHSPVGVIIKMGSDDDSI